MTVSKTPQPSSNFRLSAEQVVAGLQQWLPKKLGGKRIAVSDVVAPKGTGFSNQTFLFAAQGEDFVLQAAPVGKGLFPTYDFTNIARIQQQLGQVSQVPVASIVGVETDAQPLGVPFYVMRRVTGRAPTDKPPYHRGSWFTDLAADEQESIWWSGIDAMAKLHALDIDRDGFGFLTDTPWGMARAADPASTRIAQWRAFMPWADPEPSAPIEEALRELERTAPSPSRIAVHWGDAKLSNCMVQGGAVRALLDWELCGLSTPEEDLAHWLMLDWSLWAVTGNQRLASLPSPARTIARYEELTGRDAQHVVWWFRFGMVRLAIIYHRIMSLLRERGHVAGDATLTSVNPMVPLMAPIFEKDPLS